MKDSTIGAFIVTVVASVVGALLSVLMDFNFLYYILGGILFFSVLTAFNTSK